ncbi:hypothetical protein ABW19_dt0209979 [Dactylella cylindrospora]|nr:hypothetical protein ABW19_dt0209979 [Dactylella cylindrospora]
MSYIKSMVCRLGSALGKNMNEAGSELSELLKISFLNGSTAAELEMKELGSQYTEYLEYYSWFPLICNGAVGEATIDEKTVRLLRGNSSTSAMDIFAQAFPDIKVELSTTLLHPESGNRAIHLASLVGARNLVQMLLEFHDVDINCRNNSLDTPLLLACRSGQFEVAMLLVDKGADVMAENAFQENVLHWIHSFRFNEEHMKTLAERLLSIGSASLLTTKAKWRPSGDVEMEFVAGTPILRAIAKRCSSASNLLWGLERRFLSGRPNYEAILLATRIHDHEILDNLLSGPADLIDPETSSCILVEVFTGGTICQTGVGRILRHGKRHGENGVATLEVLCKYGASVYFDEIPGYPGCNVLSLAVSSGTIEMVEHLLRHHGCSKYVNQKAPPPSIAQSAFRGESVMGGFDVWKSPPLYDALIFNREGIFKLLVEHGANPNAEHHSNQGNLSVFHYCVLHAHHDSLIKMLLDGGNISNIDAAPDGYETPFITAVRIRRLDLAQSLLKYNPNVNHCFDAGYNFYAEGCFRTTVLGHLIMFGGASGLACIEFLLKTGKASIFTDQENTTTVLHCLATQTTPSEREDATVVRRTFELLNGNFRFTEAQLNLRDGNGSTALERAVRNCKVVVVDELLRAGASGSIHALGEDSAFQLAIKIAYVFPNGYKLEGGPFSRERQLQDAFERRTMVALLLSRKALDNVRREPR